MYREYFEKYFQNANVIPYYWLQNGVEIYEPSARILDIYKNTLNK